ncbi:hypothetical protein [Paenibacillus turpanensis]|uniref:hypothetical protein n=1 Tax=Paenibacillus turpanensis TaxID=2689078 RepID=UPI00140943B4|nr:hypothetical protein [Paenibacillus turpanensis]
MSPKRIVIVCTLAIIITISAGNRELENGVSAWTALGINDSASTDEADAKARASGVASPASEKNNTNHEHNLFYELVGKATEEEVRDALYNGHSLAELVEQNSQDPRQLVQLQVAQLQEQLISRVRQGTLSLEEFRAIQPELESLITESVNRKMVG